MRRGMLLVVIALFVNVALVSGQSGTLRWDLANISAASANALEHRVYVGAATPPVILSGVSCSATSTTGVTCAAILPASIPLGSTIQMTTFRASDGVESARSADFLIPAPPPPVVPPPTPTNLRYSGTSPPPPPPPGGLPLFRPAV